MKDFQYSSLNIVEINDFIRKDTKVYKDLKGSLCGKILNYENEIIPQDITTIEIVKNQIKYEENSFEKISYELSNPDLEDLSFFKKLSLKSKNTKELKKREKEHKNTLNMLNDRLKKHESLYSDHKAMMEHFISKIESNGFKWEDVKKLLDEKIRQGVFNDKKIKKPKDEETKIEKPLKQKNSNRRKISSASFYGDPNFYDISDLSPEQRREWEKLLKIYNHNREKLRQRDIETARMLRMSLFERNENGRYNDLLFNVSDFALIRLYRGLHRDSHEPFDYRDNARKMLRDSGHGLSFIENNTNGLFGCFKNLFESFKERDCIICDINKRHYESCHHMGLNNHCHHNRHHIPMFDNIFDKYNFSMQKGFNNVTHEATSMLHPCGCINHICNDVFMGHHKFEALEKHMPVSKINNFCTMEKQNVNELQGKFNFNQRDLEQKENERELQAQRELAYQKEGPNFDKRK